MAPANGLIHEKSPYLLQHAHNPVNWQPWGDAAFDRARTENKPVFLSIGYATCHWCHVMARESFEDADAARVLNDTFVCIKVDREERPDIDALYMTAGRVLSGGGGWPLSIFMTPDKKPFHAATYIPRTGSFGRPGLMEICQAIGTQWQQQRGELEERGETVLDHTRKAFNFIPGGDLDGTILDSAYRQIEETYDPKWGGFGPAPKFPMAHRILFLLLMHRRTGNPEALEMARKSLMAMRLGGIWDHVGLGFHRYSTDGQWLLPHFEKMLCDQALLAIVYMEAFHVTGEPLFSRTAREIFEYVLRDMTDSQGGFFTAEDADSEGEEGKFYVWPLDEFRKALSGVVTLPWEKIFRVIPGGNYLDEATRRRTGGNILHLTELPPKWSEVLGIPPDKLRAEWLDIRGRLFSYREKRPRPLKDDKILADWNGLMIAALARGAAVFEKPEYETAARRAAGFVLEKMRDETGGLYHRFREGEASVPALAHDYAFFIRGLLELHQASGEFVQTAVELQEKMMADFWDGNAGGFFTTSTWSVDLPIRPRELYDGAVPSVNSVGLENFLLLHRITGNEKWKERARMLVRAVSGTVAAQPMAYTYFLTGLDMMIGAEA
jgi:uncharacterized protein YyaL (SSP411 family)